MARKFDRGYSFQSSDFHSQPDRWQDSGEEESGSPCACEARCADRDYQGNAKRGPRAFCAKDERLISETIRDLPKTYTELSLRLARADRPGERVSGSREAPIPVDAKVQAFMREIVLVTVSWEDQVRDVAHLSDYPDGSRRDGAALADACRTLHMHLPTLLALSAESKTRNVDPDKITETEMEGGEIFYDTAGDAWTRKTLNGTDAGLEFLALHRRAGGMLGLGRQRRRITEIPCDQCSQKTLVQYEAKAGGWEPRASCTACPNSYVGGQFELLMGRVYSAQIKALNEAS